ncbi:MAG: hypothetical protein HY549_06410 [Elusimicrobia bacterium]|nr:hypothetical protein [Elusimicrobiota bacterium]
MSRPSKTGRRRQLLFLLAPLALLLVLLAALEVAARWIVSRRPRPIVYSGVEHPPYFNAPGITGAPPIVGFPITYRINRSGLRGPEVAKSKTERRRILVLGDSVVYGLAVHDHETFPAQLERQLNEGQERGWEVLNGGVSGYDAQDYAGFLRLKGLELEPDIVLLGLYRNDHVNARTLGASPAAPASPRPPQRLRNFMLRSELIKGGMELLRRSRRSKFRFTLGRTLDEAGENRVRSYFKTDAATADAVIRFVNDYRYDPSVVESVLPWLLDQKGWENVAKPLKEIKGLCRSRGIKLLVLIFPVQFEVFPGYRWPEPDRTVERILNSSGISFVNLKPLMTLTGRGDEFYLERGDLGHPSAEAYELAAAAARRKLADLGWTREPKR